MRSLAVKNTLENLSGKKLNSESRMELSRGLELDVDVVFLLIYLHLLQPRTKVKRMTRLIFQLTSGRDG